MNKKSQRPIQRSKIILAISALVILAAITVGGGVYWWQKSITGQPEKHLRPEIELYSSESKRGRELSELTPILENRLSDWIQIWKKAISEFEIDLLAKVREEPIEFVRVNPYVAGKPWEKLRKRLYVYSPNKTKFIISHLGMELYEKNGKILVGFGADSGVALVDLKDNTFNEMLFSGPSSAGFNDVIWLDDDTLVITGFSQSRPLSIVPERTIGGKWTKRVSDWTHVATLRIYKLDENKVVLYHGPEVKEKIFFSKVHKSLIRAFQQDLKEKFPNIELWRL